MTSVRRRGVGHVVDAARADQAAIVRPRGSREDRGADHGGEAIRRRDEIERQGPGRAEIERHGFAALGSCAQAPSVADLDAGRARGPGENAGQGAATDRDAVGALPVSVDLLDAGQALAAMVADRDRAGRHAGSDDVGFDTDGIEGRAAIGGDGEERAFGQRRLLVARLEHDWPVAGTRQQGGDGQAGNAAAANGNRQRREGQNHRNLLRKRPCPVRGSAAY